MINLDKKIFKAILNSKSGEVSEDTLFYYSQNKHIISAEYHGGEIVKGSLIGKQLSNGTFDFVYQHINIHNEIKIGKCLSKAILENDGRLKLLEKWQWLCDDMLEGESELMEMTTEHD